jgi:hypothetical protein
MILVGDIFIKFTINSDLLCFFADDPRFQRAMFADERVEKVPFEAMFQLQHPKVR